MPEQRAKSGPRHLAPKDPTESSWKGPDPKPGWIIIVITMVAIAAVGVWWFAGRDDIESVASPAASFVVECEGTMCSFGDLSTSSGRIVERMWAFGDGQSSTVERPMHEYQEPGPYVVTLRVTDDLGGTDSMVRIIGASASPGGQIPEDAASLVPPPIYAFGPHIGGSGGWELLDATFTAAHISPHPDTVIDELNAAQAAGQSVILLLARSAGNYKTPDGRFDLEAWKASIDEYSNIDFTPWIEDGTFLVHYLISEPMSRSRWGGQVIPSAVLEEMALYSKRYWPTLPTAVREQPTDLLQHAGGYDTPVPGWTWTFLDAAWARYSARKGPIDQFVSNEVAAARQQGLGLLFGMNVLSGGDGSSETIGYRGNWVMSIDELMEYGTMLIQEPYGCAMLMWHLNHDDIAYFGTPEVDAAMADLGALARAREPVSCVSRT